MDTKTETNTMTITVTETDDRTSITFHGARSILMFHAMVAIIEAITENKAAIENTENGTNLKPSDMFGEVAARLMADVLRFLDAKHK